jgi:multiple sugar transport system permease protein
MLCLAEGLPANPAISGDYELSLTVSPNPFQSSCTISMAHPNNPLMRLAIFDLGGHRILDTEIDGASSWQSFWHVTVPLISSVVIVGILIRVMDMFKLFDIIYLVTGGGPGDVTETISFYSYIKGFKSFSLGYTAAMAFLQLIVIIVISQIFLKFQKKQRGAM